MGREVLGHVQPGKGFDFVVGKAFALQARPRPVFIEPKWKLAVSQPSMIADKLSYRYYSGVDERIGDFASIELFTSRP